MRLRATCLLPPESTRTGHLGQPCAVDFEVLNPPLIEACALPQAWAGLDTWKILQTGAPDTLNFLQVWAAWKEDSHRPRVLHYVAIVPELPDIQQVLRGATIQSALEFDRLSRQAAPSGLAQFARILAPQLYGLMPGFHRLVFESGQVLLTLCIGPLNTMLREQNFAADTLLLLRPMHEGPIDSSKKPLHIEVSEWDQWTVKSLARCCRRDTAVVAHGLNATAKKALKQAGFDLASNPSNAACVGRYNPAWEPRTNRRTFSSLGVKPGTCLVVGAGLAGASVAASLARRGWQVQVVDAATAPAGGASGLPVGLMMPHVSADDSARSRLSRSGLRLTSQEAARHLKSGVDWSASGVYERRLEGASGLPGHWSGAREDWSRLAEETKSEAAWLKGIPTGDRSLWHARGAWVKPARLVQAWLSEPGVTFVGNTPVAKIEHAESQWVLRAPDGRVIGQAGHVVLATAMGTVPLLSQLAKLAISQPGLMGNGDEKRGLIPVLRGVSGQVSWGMHSSSDTDVMPPYPVNGSGSLIPSVPIDAGLGWFAGGTYESADLESAAQIATQHRANLERLTTLLPAVAHKLGYQFESGTVQAWRNTRCTSPNRLPVVGPLMPGQTPTLWICTALGSRGLSLSVLCAELLAARLCAEPWPIEATLAASLAKFN